MARVNVPGSIEDRSEFYPTPRAFVESCLELLPPLARDARVLDVGAGGGVWGNELRLAYPTIGIAGVELRDVAKPMAYDSWVTGSFTGYRWRDLDAIIGNPPYSMAHKWILHAMPMLKEGGHLLFLLRLAFLESERRATQLYGVGLKPVMVAAFAKRPSFSGDGGTDVSAYAAFLWRKGDSSNECSLKIVLPDFSLV